MEFSKVIFLFFGLIALSKSKPTQDDVQIEVRELLNQYRATDATNGAVNCSCIEATNCTRILKLLTKAKELSRIHPERKEAINYIRNQTCDKENQGVRCCPWEPKFFGDKDSGTWKPRATKKECGNPLNDKYVFGGQNTEFGAYPFMALLGYTGSTPCTGNTYPYTFQCGATVINKYYILTAAHCFIYKNASVILLGEHNLEKLRFDKPDDGVIYRGIEKIIMHEDYDPDFQGGSAPNDIALIRVNESIPFFHPLSETKTNVLPICLPWKRNDPGRELHSNNNYTVLGWGHTTNDRIEKCKDFRKYKAGAGILQQLDVPFLDWEECNKKANFPPGWKVDQETLVCAGGEDGKDSCGGDSGGPLISRDSGEDPWFQAGIVSFGTRICGTGTPGFYTKVAEFLPWIEKNLEP